MVGTASEDDQLHLLMASRAATGPAERDPLSKQRANVLGQRGWPAGGDHGWRRGRGAGFPADWMGHIGVNVAGAFLHGEAHDFPCIVDSKGINEIQGRVWRD